jgi:hypothetical protein
VVDVLTHSSYYPIKEEALLLLQLAVEINTKNATFLSRMRDLIDHLTELSKKSPTERVRTLALGTIGLLTNKVSTSSQFDKKKLSKSTVLDGMLQIVISSTNTMENKLESLITLLSACKQPVGTDFLLKHLEDGATQAVFKQILQLTKPIMSDSTLYHILIVFSLHIRKHYIGLLCSFIREVVDALRKLNPESFLLDSERYNWPPGIAIKLVDMLFWDIFSNVGM